MDHEKDVALYDHKPKAIEGLCHQLATDGLTSCLEGSLITISMRDILSIRLPDRKRGRADATLRVAWEGKLR
jgi:hypothetical protein